MNKTLQTKVYEKVNPKRKSALANTALLLMQKWGLIDKGWKFGWNNAKSSFGVCIMYGPNRRTIELSEHSLLLTSDEEMTDTILHEIAHALDFEERGTSDHGYKWKRLAIKVGANPNRTSDVIDKEGEKIAAYMSKYRLECPNGCVQPSHRKKKRECSCAPCGNGSFNRDLLLVQIENHPLNIPKEFGGKA